MATYSPQLIANTIIKLAMLENIKLTPMKLQKLMYLTYKRYLQITGEPLFSERFVKWEFGPVLPSIYYEFRDFRKSRITRFARDAKGRVSALKMQCLDSPAVQAVDYTWHKYKYYDAVVLSRLTHLENSAWAKAELFLKDEDIKDEPEYNIIGTRPRHYC